MTQKQGEVQQLQMQLQQQMQQYQQQQALLSDQARMEKEQELYQHKPKRSRLPTMPRWSFSKSTLKRWKG